MHLSRLILNPRSKNVQRDLARPYDLHRTLLAAFPSGEVHTARSDADAIGLLYRLDEDPRTGDLHLLVQSQQPPQWGVLAAADYLLAAGLDNPSIREFTLQFHTGQPLAFRLRANPTRRLSAGKGHKGKRIGLYAEEEQLAWLAGKGKQHGFALLQAATSRDGKIKQAAAVHAPNGVHDLEFISVRFDGILQVTDPVALLQAVGSGIGSGKAFGFGLLSLARPG